MILTDEERGKIFATLDFSSVKINPVEIPAWVLELKPYPLSDVKEICHFSADCGRASGSCYGSSVQGQQTEEAAHARASSCSAIRSDSTKSQEGIFKSGRRRSVPGGVRGEAARNLAGETPESCTKIGEPENASHRQLSHHARS